MDIKKEAIKYHKDHRGKIEIKAKASIAGNKLAQAYTPGVGAVCMEIKKSPKKSWTLTNRANQIAIVSDGSAILGLGNIGPEAGMPVMEGKSAIFKKFADVDAFPLCIKSQDTDEIVNFVKNIEPSFGGINLEDISAPRCFEILERLEKELSIPVFHDDQDGTAIVTLAALINACRITGKVMKELRVVVSGAGAAGIAISRLLLSQGVADILLLDSKGIVSKKRKDLNKYKLEIAKKTNKQNLSGGISEAMKKADVFIGVSAPKLLNKQHIKSMNSEAIILAMANPEPEILPHLALEAGASIVGTGRSDFPNQVNNALVFPGIFRGLLDSGKRNVSMNAKISAAIAIAYTIKKPTKNKILPNVSDKRAVEAIANALKNSKG